MRIDLVCRLEAALAPARDDSTVSRGIVSLERTLRVGRRRSDPF
jgi:hypothetical protein